MQPTRRSACFAWTGWEKGQGAPTALNKDGEGCPFGTHCESGRCEGGLTEGTCYPRLAGGEGCNEDADSVGPVMMSKSKQLPVPIRADCNSEGPSREKVGLTLLSTSVALCVIRLTFSGLVF